MAAGTAELQILLKARDEASKALKDAGTAGEKAAKSIQKHWKEAGLALAGAGAALEGLARSQAENSEAVERLSERIGLSNKEFRDMATDLSNVTFPLEDVLGLIELGTQAGLDSREALTQYANFWDMVGDATGLTGTELAKAGTALKAVGIAAGDEGQALAAFGFITENTKGNVADFLTFVDRTGPELRDMGLDVNDAAAVLGAMERELGLSARTARQEFRTAVSGADGDVGKMLETLGLTEAQLQKYRAEVDLSAGAIQRNADIHAASFTPIQKLQSAVKDLAFAHADAIKAAAQLAPLLIAAGPAAGIAMGAFTALRAGMTLLKTSFATTAVFARAAWAAMTGPVGIAIAAITAAIAVGVLLWKNWDTIKAKAQEIFGAVQRIFESKLGWLLPGGVLIKAIITIRDNWQTIWNSIKTVFSTVLDTITSVYQSKLGWILPGGALIKGLLFLRDNWRDIWAGMKDFVTGIWGGIVDVGRGAINTYIGIINTLIGALNTIQVSIPKWVPKVGGRTFGIDIPEIPALAHGGIVTQPTLALIGERGPEAVVPLTGPGSRGGAMSINVNITVNGTVVSSDFEEQVRRAVRDGIRRGGFDGILAPA